MAEEQYSLKEFIPEFRHALKGPLAVIKEGVSLLSEELMGPLNDKQKVFLGSMQRNVTKLLSVIQDGSEYQSLFTKTEVFEKKDVDIIDVIAKEFESLHPLAEENGLELKSKSSTVSQIITICPAKIGYVIRQLVLNAIACTDQGTIEVIADVAGNDLIISVVDTGHGINKEYFNQLFKPFAQIEKCQKALPVPNVGLGLVLANEILAQHNSEISFKSELGVGSTFSFSLAIDPSHFKKHVVLIDDDLDLCNLIKEFLIAKDIKVSILSDASIAADKVAELKPDLLVLDLNLPKLPGEEICKVIRHREIESDSNYQLPIIMLTAKDSDTDHVLGKVIGANIYMVKPFNHDELYEKIRSLLDA